MGRVAISRVVAGLSCVLLLGSACSEPPRSATAPHAGHSIPPAAPLRDGERFVTLSMPAAYTPAAPNGGTDEYRCFLVDPGLTEGAFLTGN
ncbi:monooxygenase, partial [Actinoplanes sp. NPDC051633]